MYGSHSRGLRPSEVDKHFAGHGPGDDPHCSLCSAERRAHVRVLDPGEVAAQVEAEFGGT